MFYLVTYKFIAESSRTYPLLFILH